MGCIIRIFKKKNYSPLIKPDNPNNNQDEHYSKNEEG